MNQKGTPNHLCISIERKLLHRYAKNNGVYIIKLLKIVKNPYYDVISDG